MLITKRDGTLQEFDRNKIKKSILACFEACGEESISEVDTVVSAIEKCMGGVSNTVAAVQTCTERTLIEYAYHEAAAAFMEYRIERDMIRETRLKPDALALSDYIQQAKYARWNVGEGRREDYSETVDRVVEMHYKFFGMPTADVANTHYSRFGSGVRPYHDVSSDITSAFRHVYTKDVLPSMRSMQFAGKAIEKNHARMYNCCFTHVDRMEVFSETLFLLLSGCGVGYSVQWEHVDQLPILHGVDPHDVFHFTVPDSIEGWADAVRVLIESYMYEYSDPKVLGKTIEFNYSQIRPEGSSLLTSGGRAPGHLGLKAMLEEVRSVLDGSVGRRLRPIECHDMMCYTARAVLSGGIRRSSMISLFSSSDTEMMYAKAAGVFVPDVINSQRSMANNAAALVRSTVTRDIFNRILELSSVYGDPGFVFLDDPDFGINPCGEIILNPKLNASEPAGFAFCNLTEVNAAACSSLIQFRNRCRSAAIIGTLQACYTDFSYLHPRSRLIAERDALIGVSVTGIMDNPACLEWMVVGRADVISENKRMASLLGINDAARCCCIKPSGTASLLLGTSSGIHCHHARRYLRRVTCNPTEVVGRAFADANPHMVEQKPNGDYVLVFPVQARDDAVIGETGVTFLQRVVHVIGEWCGLDSGHNVSCTVPLLDGERDAVINFIWEQRCRLTALAFAPVDLSVRYPFAPLEAVDGAVLEAYWDQLIRNYTAVDWTDIGEGVDGTDPSAVAACSSGRCSL